MSETYGVIGVGSIAAAIVTGLCARRRARRRAVAAQRWRRAADWRRASTRVTVAADNQAVVDGADVVVVCAAARARVEPCWPTSSSARAQAVVSVVAGVTLDAAARLVGAGDRAWPAAMPLPAVAGTRRA